MRKIIYTLTILSLISCSSKLSNSEAKDIINNCLKTNKSIYIGKGFLVSGKATVISKNTVAYKYHKNLESEGYILMKPLGNDFYKITFTDKAKKYVMDYDNVRIYQYQISDIKEIKEEPAKNIAKVKGTLEKINKTPFYDANYHEAPANKNKLQSFNITLRKTNDGWKYCN